MSLSSTELNYLVWRYLQESGYDLAAYALDKNSQCLKFEDDKNSEIMTKIEPGYLVNLVQKGLLYSLTEEELRPENSRSEILTFFGSLLKEERDNELFQLDGFHKLVNNQVTNEDNHQDHGEDNTKEEEEVENNFTTEKISASLTYDESVISKWHPMSNEVFGYIQNKAQLLITAVNEDKIVESASVKGPRSSEVGNSICTMAWSPSGHCIVTANIGGDICSWSLEGRLKNITNGVINQMNPGIITDIIWNDNGQYFLSADSHSRICIWDGSSLEFIQEISSSSDENLGCGLCWIDDYKFAMSTDSNSITVNVISMTKNENNSNHTINGGNEVSLTVKPVVNLKGHDGIASNLVFNSALKLLASFSDVDGVIKLWLSNSTSTVATLNDDKIYPVVILKWLPSNDFENGYLLNVSIDGTMRLWNTKTEKLITSTNIFNSEGYKLDDENNSLSTGTFLFNGAVSPNEKWLAIGDDTGRVTVWNVDIHGTNQVDGFKFKCHGVFHHYTSEGSIINAEDGAGICNISWCKSSQKFCVSYKGTSSVIINWNH